MESSKSTGCSSCTELRKLVMVMIALHVSRWALVLCSRRVLPAVPYLGGKGLRCYIYRYRERECYMYICINLCIYEYSMFYRGNNSGTQTKQLQIYLLATWRQAMALRSQWCQSSKRHGQTCLVYWCLLMSTWSSSRDKWINITRVEYGVYPNI